MSTIISRLQLSHPDLGAPGGVALHDAIEAMFVKIGDNTNARYLTQSALANSASVDLTHNLKCPFADLRYDLYLDDGSGNLTEVTATSTPNLSQFTIAATVSFLTTKITVTNNSGATRNIALVVIQDPITLNELVDVDTTSTPPTDQDYLRWNNGSGQWVPGSQLPINKGGTNSVAALSNNRVMKSVGGAIVEAAAITASKALASDANGIPVAATTSTAELNFLAGVTSAVQTQIDSKVAKSGDTMSGFLTLSADPTSNLHAATKQYVDALITGADPKGSVKASSTANIASLTGAGTFDGVALIAGDLILVQFQTTASQNGIYTVASGAWTRALNMDAWAEVPGALVVVEQGTLYGDTGWICTADQGGTLGSTSITWSQFFGPGNYTADGNGIELVGRQFQLELDGTTLSKSATGLKANVATTDLTDYQTGAPAPQDGQTIVYNSGTGKYSPGASGDSSFKLQAVAANVLTLKGGFLLIDDERELATFNATYGADLSVTLTSLLASPVNGTTYYLYIDLDTLAAVVTEATTNRKLYAVIASNLVLSATIPEQMNPRRYIPLGLVQGIAGNSYSTTVLKTLAFRRHDTLTRFFAYPELYTAAITTATTTNTLTHNLSGKPQVVWVTYFDGTNEFPVDQQSVVKNVSASQIIVSSLGFTFGGGQELRVYAERFPQQPALSSSSRSFTSQWFTTTATTTLPHGLNDIEDIKGMVLEEWNVSTGKYKILPPDIVTNFDAVNLNLNWTGYVPSATLQYRLVVGGSPNPYSIPLEFGGYTKFVGNGPSSYASLTAALAASTAGDSILVMRDVTEATDVNVNVADIRIDFKPGANLILAGALTNGLRVTAARVKIDRLRLNLQPTGTQAKGLSIEAADAWVEGLITLNTVQTLTDGVNVSSGGVRAYVQVGIDKGTGTAVTNLITNNDGAGNANVWGG